MWIQFGRRGGGMVRVGRRMVNTDHPRVLFLAVDRASYKPILEKPWQEACAAAAARIPQIMAEQLADNLAHAAAKRGGTRMAASAPEIRTWQREATLRPGSRTHNDGVLPRDDVHIQHASVCAA